ncbi:MAG: SDR family oxidoreductase [Vulcanimicrobiota bacterium]
MKLLITGAANGIGRALADAFEEDGATVLRVDKEACQYQVDLSQPAAIEELVANLDGPLDGLVNNAGVMVRKPPEQLTLEEWNRVLATNLTAPFLLTRGLAARLREGRGRVVNIASTRALMSEPNTEAYAASKGGLVALTHCLAVSLGPEITVNCISPGWIDTKGEELRPEDHAQHPAGRVGTPADVVGLVRYLLSEEAGFVTGSNFVIDGGMTRKMIYVP